MVGSLGALSMLAGCAMFTNEEPGAEAWAAPYPETADRPGTLDIQVFRENTRISLTNTTPRALPAGRIWLNRRFSHPVDELAAGESIDLSLLGFVDEFGEVFRAGGFFATIQPDPVVLVEWGREGEGEEAAELIGLVIVSNEMS